jgi:hypothetical protein
MISRTDISNTIDDLDKLFNAHPSEGIYFSKLALLELCGWIELTMDCIITDCAVAKLTDPGVVKSVSDDIVGPVFGFHYAQHFRQMLMKLIGLITLEQVEQPLIVSGQLHVFKSQLGSLYEIRKRAAHTNIHGVTITYQAPSSIKGFLNNLFPVLQQYETALAAL